MFITPQHTLIGKVVVVEVVEGGFANFFFKSKGGTLLLIGKVVVLIMVLIYLDLNEVRNSHLLTKVSFCYTK